MVIEFTDKRFESAMIRPGSRLEAFGSGRVVFIWGSSRILVGSFDCFQVDLFHMNIIFVHFTSVLVRVFERILHYRAYLLFGHVILMLRTEVGPN